MRWATLSLLLFGFGVLAVDSFPKRKQPQVFMATIDLDTDRKQRHVDPEIVVDLGSQLPPVGVVKRNVTQAPDYGDYEDYELTAKPDQEILLRHTTTVSPRVVKIEKEHTLLDSQYKSHVKISVPNQAQKSSGEIRDEVARLMGDLHREELTLRTTVTRDDMTSPSPVDVMLLGNETMFFSDEEGSGEMVEDVNVTSLAKSSDSATSSVAKSSGSSAPLVATTRAPLLFTTLIQEVKTVHVTARPDPFAHLDYDLADHSNLKKQGGKPLLQSRPPVEKQKKFKLHGGSVGGQSAPLVRVNPNPNPTSRPLSRLKTGNPFHAQLVRPGRPVSPGNQTLNRKKNLRKIKKIDRHRRVKNLNHRLRAQNRMRLRKVLSKMLFGPRDSDVTTSPKNSSPNKTKLRFVGSNGIVTPSKPRVPVSSRKLKKPQIEFHNRNRDKRQVEFVYQPSSSAGGGSWAPDTVPIEKSIIESIHFEPHPYYHLRASAPDARTQVEPSLLINEDPMEEEKEDREDVKLKEPLPLVRVTIKQPKRLKMVTLKGVKKVSKKAKKVEEKNANGVARVESPPTAKKPTMLELLIGDFLERIPPTARNPFLTEEQWS